MMEDVNHAIAWIAAAGMALTTALAVAGWVAARAARRNAAAEAAPAETLETLETPMRRGRVVVDGPPDVAAVIVVRARTVQTVIEDGSPSAPEEAA